MTLDDQALAACKKARGEFLKGEERLHNAREAGRLLAAIEPEPGVRTSSSGLTRFQTVCKQAGISRQTANFWKQLAAVPEDVVRAYIEAAKRDGIEITLIGLLPKDPEGEAKPILWTFEIRSEEVKRRLKYRLNYLVETEFGTTDADVAIALIDGAYEDSLRKRGVQ